MRFAHLVTEEPKLLELTVPGTHCAALQRQRARCPRSPVNVIAAAAVRHHPQPQQLAASPPYRPLSPARRSSTSSSGMQVGPFFITAVVVGLAKCRVSLRLRFTLFCRGQVPLFVLQGASLHVLACSIFLVWGSARPLCKHVCVHARAHTHTHTTTTTPGTSTTRAAPYRVTHARTHN